MLVAEVVVRSSATGVDQSSVSSFPNNHGPRRHRDAEEVRTRHQATSGAAYVARSDRFSGQARADKAKPPTGVTGPRVGLLVPLNG